MKAKTKVVSFRTTTEETRKIAALADRAVSMAARAGVAYTKQDAMMDMAATHANGCPIDLDKLAAADDFNFAHDVFGIRRHLNRVTGELEDCFLPRCRAPRVRAVA